MLRLDDKILYNSKIVGWTLTTDVICEADT